MLTGITGCSGIQSESKPAASVARAISVISPPFAVIAARNPISIGLAPCRFDVMCSCAAIIAHSTIDTQARGAIAGGCPFDSHDENLYGSAQTCFVILSRRARGRPRLRGAAIKDLRESDR